jgi:cell division topological specificity factor
MDWLKIWRSEPKNTASVAKERLKLVVAHQREGRANGSAPAYLNKLREELLSVVRKYVQVPDSAVQVNVQREAGLEVLEMNITLPETPAA